MGTSSVLLSSRLPRWKLFPALFPAWGGLPLIINQEPFPSGMGPLLVDGTRGQNINTRRSHLTSNHVAILCFSGPLLVATGARYTPADIDQYFLGFYVLRMWQEKNYGFEFKIFFLRVKYITIPSGSFPVFAKIILATACNTFASKSLFFAHMLTTLRTEA